MSNKRISEAALFYFFFPSHLRLYHFTGTIRLGQGTTQLVICIGAIVAFMDTRVSENVHCLKGLCLTNYKTPYWQVFEWVQLWQE